MYFEKADVCFLYIRERTLHVVVNNVLPYGECRYQ